MGFVPTRLPSGVNTQILGALRHLGVEACPQFVPVRPVEGARRNKCIFNVQRAVHDAGGVPVFGRKLFEWPRVLTEFIGHVVLKRNDVLVCVTPDSQGESEVLFVEDPTISFGSSDPLARLPYHQAAFSSNEDIASYIRCTNEIRSIKTQFAPTSELIHVPGPAGDRLKRLELAARNAIHDIVLRTRSPQTPCIFGSARKFGTCCRVGMQRERDARRRKSANIRGV
jgi:hypothetical protein